MMLFGLTACGNSEAWTPSAFDDKTPSKKLTDGQVIAENDTYRLEWVATNCSVALIEKETGNRWGTTPFKEGEPLVDEDGFAITKHPRVESAVVLKYMNEKTNLEEEALSFNSAVKNGRVRTELISNGVKVEYYFDDADIMIPVEYTLREDSVAVKMDPTLIQENENRAVAVTVTPFWCYNENDVEGDYLFYPSGSGALVSNTSVSAAGTTYASSVYGRDLGMVLEDLTSTEKSVRLPVYGAKTGEIATCAIIESAADSADIEAKVGSTGIKYSGVYATYQLRGYSSNVAVFMKGLEKQINVYSDGMADTPMVIGFYPLTGEDANYSGMAKTYKNYLKSSGALTETRDDTILNVTIVGGTMINKSFLGVPYKDILAATTLNEAKAILEDLRSKTDVTINAKLIGFGTVGLEKSAYAGGFKINDNFGTLKDLSVLSGYCKENNINLYYDFDLTTLKESDAGFSTFFDTAYNALGKVAVAYEYDPATRSFVAESSYNLLKRNLLPSTADMLLKKTAKWDFDGISLETLSSISYSDYSDEISTKHYSRGNMASDVTQIMNKLGEKKKLASYDANSYAAVLSDVIFETSTRSSMENIFSCDVPFYQMVFKGYVPMSGESMNMAAEPKDQLLRTVESGVALNYILTANYYNEFIDYDGYYFFGSCYEDLSASLISQYNELKDYYTAINGAEIVKHTLLDGGLRETVYDNGVIVYVNYSDAAATSPIGEVAAKSFVWEVK